jgi:8-oxo-dGTP pyrophosphatase MutT (NUDIX family)
MFRCSVGGHVMTDESYLQAFKRELMEELNIELSVGFTLATKILIQATCAK